MIQLLLAQSPIHISGTDVMEMSVNDDEKNNNNGKDEGGYRRE